MPGFRHDDETKQRFLDALAETGNVTLAIRAAGIASRQSIRKWRAEDELFADAYSEAIEESSDALEAEAWRRAKDGVLREKAIGSGENARFIEEYQYSDTLLLALLKANRPDRFADRSKSELSGPNGEPLTPSHDPTAAAAHITALLDEARRRRAAAQGDDPDPFE